MSPKSVSKAPGIRIVANLFLLTFLLFLRAANNGFVDYDDGDYVFANRHLKAGLTWTGARWAFTTFHAANWHPLTWLSHMLDYRLFGMHPAGHHLSSVFLHACNASLLYVFLQRSTGRSWASAVAAALFACHPLRVESVAWISERKDVLSGFFALLCLIAYERHTRGPTLPGYLLVVVAFAAGLASKPMVVTLPFLLLLLDYWPLCRSRIRMNEAADASGSPRQRHAIGWLVLEKLPLLLMSAAACIVTYLAQSSGGALDRASAGALPQRLSNIAVAYVRYLWKTAWPLDLAPFYPMPAHWPPPAWAGAALLLSGATMLSIFQARRRPHLAVGWFWFLGMLVPAIGLVQVGAQSMADRYSYLPGIGLAIIIVWSFIGCRRELGCLHILRLASAGFILLVLATITWRQIGFWRDDLTLFSHALEVTQDNWLAHGHVGQGLAQRGETAAAERHYAEALRLHPANPAVQYDWANLLLREGHPDQAIARYQEALALSPANGQFHYNLGVALASKGNYRVAQSQFEQAVHLNPDDADAECALATALAKLNRNEEAIDHYRRALELDPRSQRAQQGLARCQEQLNRRPQANP